MIQDCFDNMMNKLKIQSHKKFLKIKQFVIQDIWRLIFQKKKKIVGAFPSK